MNRSVETLSPFPETQPKRMSIELLMGPEGSGKSTIVARLARYFDKPKKTLGDVIRAAAADSDSPYHDRCKTIIAKGGYLEASILEELITPHLLAPQMEHGFIVDGAGRTLEEVQFFHRFIATHYPQLPVTVISLRIPARESFKRLVEGEDARRRAGDTTDGVLERLTNYYTGLGERMSFIRRETNWRIQVTSAIPSAAIVYEQVRAKLDTTFSTT